MSRVILMLCLALGIVKANAQTTPELEFVMQLRVTIGEFVQVGESAHGVRQSIAITGGTFEGPEIKGKVLAGGADYQLCENGRTNVEAIYNIRTDDGANIHVRNVGIISSDAGKPYFFTAPKFEAPSNSKYAWLNNAIFVCRPSEEQMNGGIVLNVWKVKNPFVYESTIGDIKPIPQSVFGKAAQQGKMETFYYNVKRNGQTLKKRAQVYLPYGYKAKDKKVKYNVLYLMHGGGDNTTSFLTPPKDWLPLRQVLDHLIAEKKMDPVIVVTPTFYHDDQNIGANKMDDAIALCRNFHTELQNELIPAVESTYNTYLEGKDSVAVTNTRSHRAYGGFSMGALSTWFQLAYGVNAVKYFIPLSGDLWVYDDKGQKQDSDTAARWINGMLEKSGFANDFCVYGYTGTKDIAGTPQKNLIKSLHDCAPVFRYDTADANLFFSMKKEGQHYYGDINQYLYYALPLLFK